MQAVDGRIEDRHLWEVFHKHLTITVPLEFPNVYTLDLSHCYGRAYERNRWPARLGSE